MMGNEKANNYNRITKNKLKISHLFHLPEMNNHSLYSIAHISKISGKIKKPALFMQVLIL